MLGYSALAVPAAAQAQSTEDALVSCARDANNATRLKCYDGIVGSLSAAAKVATTEREAAMAIIAAEQAKADEAAKTAAFGAERLNRGQVPMGTITRVDAKVAEMMTAADGMAVLLLDNGQLWRQTTGLALPVVRNGDVVIITQGKIGSYQLELVRQHRAFNVKRIR
ncbi:MAG: hypothetical protein ACRCUI_11220 [Polymorphobacter sp.]